MPFLRVNDAELYYEMYGSGPALVFAHGLGGNHLSWWQQVAHFQDRYTCVTFSHRGFGLSTDPNGRGPAAFVDDLASLINHLGLAEVRLVAQSMGGWTCLEYTLRHLERVRALVMADTIGGATHPEIARILAEHAARQQRAAYFERGIHPAAGERMANEQPAMHLLYRELDTLSVGLDKEAVRAVLHGRRSTPPEALAALHVPVLCISGEEDVVIPTAAVAVFASLIPGARLARVPEAGHSVYWERPAVFNALLDEFLGGVATVPIARTDAAGRAGTMTAESPRLYTT